jgi:hypothetical protein
MTGSSLAVRRSQDSAERSAFVGFGPRGIVGVDERRTIAKACEPRTKAKCKMARSTAKTPAAYLKELPADRRREVGRVREMVRKHLPAGYRETMNWGMITYEVPLDRHPKTYNGQPLCFAALAAQKNYLSLYFMPVDAAALARLKAAFDKAGKKLDMGKSCIRFKRADDLPLDAIGAEIAAVPLDRFVAYVESARQRRG